ncbi:transcriptional regulator [Novosphingobium barchaimii LL02]|uniref:Transcriptional regulator n=2 Tax=Novosphingobium barchaimii TaxID=1420591 RepID=A0A0J7XTR0_9SPHN|nr:transcriptional regulator [Novosphingobium barchaimii LL02]
MLSIGRTKLYDLMNAGDLQSITIGSARRIPHSELLRFREAQPLAA